MFTGPKLHPDTHGLSGDPLARSAPLVLDLRDTLPLYTALEKVFRNFTSLELSQFSRFEQVVENGRNFLMPARLGDYEAFKIIRSRPANTARGLERSQSSILVTDTTTGRDAFLVSGAGITPFKASALTALALDHWLAAHTHEPIRLGIIGGGPVARAHLIELTSRYGSRVENALIYSPHKAAERIVGELGLTCRCLLAERHKIVRECNVIVTATPSMGASVSFEEIRGRPTFVSGVGFFDLAANVIHHASQIISEDPLSYLQSTKPLGALSSSDSSGAIRRKVVGLSEIYQGNASITTGAVTLFMQYGTAMTDLAIILAAMKLPYRR